MSSIVKPSRLAALLCAGLLCLLAACETTGPRPSGEQRAENLARSGQHAEAAAHYIDLATRVAGEERDRLTLLAIEQWLDAGDGRRAHNALSTIAKPAGGELRWLWTSNAAAVALWEGEPDEALGLLEPLAQEPLSLRYRSRVEALRADAYFQKDQPARAVELYLQRESWLRDPAWMELSRQRLWSGLLVSDAQTLRETADRTRQPLVKGWLELGALATSTGQSGVGWRNGLARWREDWPRHPANAMLEGMPVPEDGDVAGFPRQIAVLLPLTGQNAAAGSALRNGFLGAYFSAAPELEDEQQIRLYDVNGGGTPEAYQRAVTDGAQFVVGPLLRPNVAELAAQAPLPVPVLTLNYLPDDAVPPAGFYQFALAPEDEAVSAADRALADGHHRAVALVPNNDWGRRMLSSFATAFEAGGGVLLEYRDYRPTMQDFSFEIEGLMALNESVQRYQRLRANIGGPLQFDPRRRQDVEFVFLAADAKAGRLIKSQLKFHYAGDLPVYSTSFIYSMDGRSNSDLNGVMFADTPWVIAPRPWMSHLPALYNEYWPDERRLARLHAMGYDAYQLVAELHAAGSGPMPELSGATGRLYLDAEGRVHRRLAWARFAGGKPVALEMDRPIEPGGPDEAEVPGPWQRRRLNP